MDATKLYISNYTSVEGVRNKNTNILYPSMLNALLANQNIKDLEVYWDPWQNWKQGRVVESIDPLADERLQELRDSYKYMELAWGGGYDSSYIIEVAILTNIPFDAITMYVLESISNTHKQNQEFIQNKDLLDRYIKKFPKTKINFVDYLELEKYAIQDKDFELWSTTYGMWDDILQLYGDKIVKEREQDKSVFIIGTGYKQVCYNNDHNIWSLLVNSYGLAGATACSFTANTMRFYETPCMMNTIAHKQTKYKKTLSTQEIQKLMYPDLKIFHLGKEDDSSDWWEHPKFTWFVDNGKINPRLTEYKEFLNVVNETVGPDNWKTKGEFPFIRWKDCPLLIDFYKE